MPINPINKEKVESIKALDGIYRKTLMYNDEVMLCLFTLERNSTIPLHHHNENQIGYVLKGKIKFKLENGNFIAKSGDSYLFNSMEKHGAEVLEDTEILEVFSPSRDEYK